MTGEEQTQLVQDVESFKKEIQNLLHNEINVVNLDLTKIDLSTNLSMIRYTRAETSMTPFVDFDPEKGIFDMRGKSIPEDAVSFYKPIMEWLDNYGESPQPATEVNISLEYFNTNSSKFILDLFFKLVTFHKSGKTSVTINWIVSEDDDDMIEAGEDYAAIVEVPMNILTTRDENS
ncbi:MAG: DUF1987 domain-containing protein [Flavobacteriales bacterium]|nr:DUF1987 domain-containing protein [Flavobacteriales bacterium]